MERELKIVGMRDKKTVEAMFSNPNIVSVSIENTYIERVGSEYHFGSNLANPEVIIPVKEVAMILIKEHGSTMKVESERPQTLNIKFGGD